MMIRQGRSGFTLLELLLSIGLMAMLLSGIYSLFDDWLQRAVNRQAAPDTLRLQQAAADYVYTNYESLKADNVGNFTEIDVTDLIAGNFLPSGYQARNAFKQPMRVFKRARQTARVDSDGNVATDSSGNIILLTTIDVLTIADDIGGGASRMDNKRILDAAKAGGPQMGVYSEIVIPGATFTGRITSPFKDWYISASPMPLPGYTASPDSSGGYLAAFSLVNGEEIDVNDNYLYRMAIDGRPELNRMEADLYMNSNAIEDVGNMVADKVSVTGNAAFRGITQGATSETSQAMTVDQALRIDGAGSTRFNMKTATAGCGFTALDGNNNRDVTGAGCDIQGGELQVISTSEDAIMDVTGNVSTDGTVITDSAFANGGTTSQGTSTFINVDGDSLSATTSVITPTTNIRGGSITTEQMQAAAVNVYGSNAGGNRLQVNGALVAAGVQPNGTATHNFTTDDMELGNAATMDGILVVGSIDVTNALQIGTIDTDLDNNGTHASFDVQDTVLNRTVQCTYVADMDPGAGIVPGTYCEPRGTASYSWNGGTYLTVCSINGTGYECNHYQNSVLPANYIGECEYTRTMGTGNKAVHNEVCTPI